jgi:hypothetical protein
MGTVTRARIQNITHLCSQETNALTRKDTVILWGGSNYIAKNETASGLRHLRKYVNSKKNMNFILIAAPHRYDLTESSCVMTK